MKSQTIIIRFYELPVKLKEISSSGGSVSGMKVANSGYELSVQWPENTAGDATERASATPPVHYESNNSEQPMTQPEI